MTRFVDRGAQVAGWIGVGTAVVVVVAFGLVLPIQPIVYVAALPMGLLIGWYANSKAERRRPRGRAITNATWAALLTGLTFAIFYVGVRLLFSYADNGYPSYNITAGPDRTPSPTTCVPGPACTYLRYLEKPEQRQELAGAGVTDVDSFTRYWLAEQASGGLILFGLTLAGGAVAGLWQALRPPVARTAPPDTGEAAPSST